MTEQHREWEDALSRHSAKFIELALEVGDGIEGRAFVTVAATYGIGGLIANKSYETFAKALATGLEMGFSFDADEEDESDPA